MFMLKVTMEKELREKEIEKEQLNMYITQIERKHEHAIKIEKLKRDEFIVKFKTEMQEELVKSDLLRNEAIAKLEIYEKLDTKADANVIKSMLNKLIEALGKSKEVQIIK